MIRPPLVVLALSATIPAGMALAQTAGIPPVTVTTFTIPEGVDPDSPVGSLRYRGAVVIESTDADRPFTGLSGFWVSPDGSRFAGTEGGNWVEGALAYDANGNLSGFSIAQTGALLDANGQPFADDLDRDAESLDHDGTNYLVGFEGNNRVLRYKDFRSPAVPVPLPPVSLSSFANGDLLVLEIYQHPETVTINVTRLGRIPASEIAIGGSMNPVEIATLQPPWTEVRFEGSAVRTGADGDTLIYVIQNAAPSVLFMFELT
jgi:hypothetical protein